MAYYESDWYERNSEATHAAALAKSKALHDAVREKAVGTLQIEMLRLETERLRLQRIQTAERVRLETERAMEAVRIREEENKAKLIPKPPPRVPTPPPPKQPFQQPTPPTTTPAPVNPQAVESAKATSQTPTPNLFQPSQKQAPQVTVPPNSQQPAIPQQTPASNPLQAPSQHQHGSQQQNHVPQPTQAPSTLSTPKPEPSSSQPDMGKKTATQNQRQQTLHPSVDLYVDIHKRLKMLRALIRKYGEQIPQFKKATGDMRRAITRSVGQLTEGRDTNRDQVGV
jgi:nucleoporin GLE1